MTLYSLCLIAFVAVTVPFQPLLAAAEGLVALLVILVGRRRNKMAQASVRQYMDRVSGGMDTARSSNMLYAPLPMLVFDVATGEILWCNDMFTDLTGLKDKIFETAVDAVIPTSPTAGCWTASVNIPSSSAGTTVSTASSAP